MGKRVNLRKIQPRDCNGIYVDYVDDICSCIFLLLLMALAYREDGESLHVELEGGEFD